MSLSHDKSSNECGGDYINNKNQVVFASDDYNSNSSSSNNKNKNSKDNDDDNNDIFVSSPTLETESATKNTRKYDNSSDANDNFGIVYPSNSISKEEQSDNKEVEAVLVPLPPSSSSPKNDDVDDSDMMNGDINNDCSTNNNVNYNVNANKSVTSNNNNISNITNTSNHKNGTGNIGSSINTTNKPYPADTYSFLSLYGPIKNPGYFSYGLMVYVFQMTFLMLMVLSIIHPDWSNNGDGDNPDGGRESFIERIARSIPANVSPITRATQVAAMLSYFIFADSTILDVVMAIELFPRFNQATHDDKIGCMVFSSILRLTQGTLAIFVTFFLVITTPTTIDIILNFTAINFISTLDNVGFRIIKWGKYGPKFEEEAKRIETLPLPRCIYRKYKHIRYLCTVIPIGMMFFSMIGYIIILQEDNSVWITKTFRVQFQDKEQGLQVYNGCYKKNEAAIDRKEGFKRKLYEGFGNNAESAKFSYCIKDRRWILFKGDITNACDLGENNNALARSSKTDTFDVATMFGETWYSSSNTPLDVYFIEEVEQENVNIELNENTCSSFIGDGNCDLFFNTLDFRYDGGDCCAATCSGSNCGIGSLTNAFGGTNTSGDGFPDCTDPDLVPVTIRLDNVLSSKSGRVELDQIKPLLFIDCDERSVLSMYVDKSMENHTETIMVNDGANCSITIRNETSARGYRFVDADTIWYVKYTIFHGDKTSMENNSIVVAQSFSGFDRYSNFKRIPECLFSKLSDHFDNSTVYTGIYIDPSAKAIDWLMNDGSENSMCEDSFFLERYALSVISFANPSAGSDFTWISERRQCVWPSIKCDNGAVVDLDLSSSNLTGSFPTQIGMLNSLEDVWLDSNQFTGSIPSEIGLLTSLYRLYLDFNQLTGSIPSEIGLMTSLEELELRTNGLTGSIPIEIGLLTSLEWLGLNANSLTGSIQSEIMVISLEFLDLGTNELNGSIPSEMGSITSLKELWLNYNELTSTIPSEIGMLNSLKDLRLNYNRITGSIPREIGLLTSLEELWLDENVLNGSIPNEIGLMKSLIWLRLNENQLSGSIPSEIGLLTLITDLRFNNNQLTGSIPSEIGLLTSLESLILNNNQLTGSIPSEIGLLTSLESLILNNNQLTGSIPSEIGLLTSLESLILNNNQLTGSIPSEIGLLTSLESLILNNNQLTGSIPSEIGLLTSIVELSLKLNELTGSIPSEIGLMTSLTRLFLNYNQLTGSIPSEIELLTLLELFWLNSNQLTGSFPSEIGLMTSLTSLLWNDNNFTNSIPSPNSCTIDIKLTGCPKTPEISLDNDCQGRPTEITFKYNGGSCAQSDNNKNPQTFTCTDSNGGPPTPPGTQNYITATALGGGDLYFAGPVKVGERYTFKVRETYSLNADGQFDTLSSDITITIFESQGGAALQTTDMKLSCANSLFLFDTFGANAITQWVEPSGRVVTDTHTGVETVTIEVDLEVSTEQTPVRIMELSVLTNTQDAPIDYTSYVAGQIVPPGSSIELPGFAIDIELSQRVRYTFFATIHGETLDGTNTCNGSGFLDCTVGFNLDTDFPTMVPTPSPTITPFPTPDPLTTTCEIDAEITCNVLSLEGVACDQILAPKSATCPAGAELSVAYLKYDGSLGDIVFVEVICDKSTTYIDRSIAAGETFLFHTRANSCEEVTFVISDADPDIDGNNLAEETVSTLCPGPWTLGATIAGAFVLDAYIDTEDDGASFTVNVNEAEVEFNFLAENSGAFPLTVVSGVISDTIAGADSGIGGTSQVAGLPATLPPRSRTTLQSVTNVINLDGRSGEVVTISMGLVGQTNNQFALPCEDEASLTFTL